ncbi:gasdermin-A [Aythya fuligula]|uniref:Gasdermin-A n=1 Tax=Aythya fuligula TaxID=219594 RepID=A0A6J3EB64_AYTFU|nr:gasdermin-A [Aythya fuligula]
MFKKVTQNVAKQMDPSGNLVPVESIIDQDHFRTFCLVTGKGKTSLHQFLPYKRTEYKLHDVLLPGTDDESDESFPCGDQQDSRHFTTAGRAHDQIDGVVRVDTKPAQVELGGSASFSKEWSIKMEKKAVDVKQLEALSGKRKLDVNHPFIQQLRRMQQNLYVVHETVEASDNVSYEESKEKTGQFVAQLYAKLIAKGTCMRKQSITIPKGCILAFKAIQVTIKDAAWQIHYFPESKTPTFVSDGVIGRQLDVLKKEVRNNCQILSQLPVDLRSMFLGAIKAALRDTDLFEELTQKMGAFFNEPDNCELTTQSPKLKDMLSSLQSLSENERHNLAGAIYYTLQALSEQTEVQRLFLLESLEMETVRRQRTRVERFFSFIGGDTEGRSGGDDILLPFSANEEEETTNAVLEMSGVRIQEDGSALCNQKGFSALEALYPCLYALDLLSNSQ